MQLNNLKQVSRSWVKHCEEGELYPEEPVEFAEIIEEKLESSSEDLGENETDPHKETFDDKNEVSDHEWDPHGLTSSAPPSPAACMDKIKEESIHSEAGEDKELVNSYLADPITLDDVNDITDKEREDMITSIKSGDLSPVVCLEKIIEEGVHSEPGEHEVLETSDDSNKEKSDSFDKTKDEFGGTMDESDYKTRLAKVWKSVMKTHLRIEEFTPDSVTIGDKSSYKADLDRIRNHLEATRNLLYDLITDLDPALDKARITQLKKLDKQVVEKFKENEKSVKEEMDALLDAADVAAKTAENVKEEKAAEFKKAKFEIRIQNNIKKIKRFKETIEAIGDCDDMSEQTIRKNLLESKEWERKLDALIAAKETIDEETVNVTFDSNTKAELDSEFDKLLKIVEEKVKKLILMDAELGLYTLAPSKVKENIVYPKPFEGTPGEDVYKFVLEFEEAMAADQVRTKDKVKTLIKYLKGEAKKTIGEYHKTLDDALNDLKNSFGNPVWIWQTLINDLENKVHSRAWGKPYTFERLKMINEMLNFIRKAEALAEQHQNLHNEVYSFKTISMLKQLVPHKYMEEMNRRVPMSIPSQDKMLRIKAILEEEKNATLNGIPDKAIYVPRKCKSDYPKVQFGSRYKQNCNRNSHDCSSSDQCNTKWDMLGCIELYKLTTVEERKNMLISMKMCFKCGAPFTPGVKAGKYLHSCKWFPADKRQARCQGQNGSKPCYFAAATCLVHKDNISQGLRSWLSKSKLKIVDYKPSTTENVKEKEKLIDLLKNRRKQEKFNENIDNLMKDDGNTEHIGDEVKAPRDDDPTKITEKERKKNSDFENSKINRTREHPRIVHTEILKCLELISQQQLGLPLYASHQRPGVWLKPNKQEKTGLGDKGSLLEGVVLNENNPVLLL